MRAALHGDLGKSILSREPITPLLLAAMGRSALLGGLGLLISLVLSVPLGIGAAQAISPLSRVLDKICTVYGALTASLPSPWLGPILMYLFAVRIPLFPITGHWLLPALVLALSLSGFWARLIRSRVRETLHHGSALCARARGLPQWKILLKYGFAPCAGPIAAYLGTQLGSLLGGLFVIEVIFGWPGLGALFVDSVLKRDYPVVEAALFASALIALLGNGLGDWMQDRVDPRRRVL
jgi:peptide/nickel transport system permease protein